MFPKLKPWVDDRLLSLERCPQGVRGPCFFQKEAPAGMPPGTPTKAHPARQRHHPLRRRRRQEDAARARESRLHRDPRVGEPRLDAAPAGLGLLRPRSRQSRDALGGPRGVAGPGGARSAKARPLREDFGGQRAPRVRADSPGARLGRRAGVRPADRRAHRREGAGRSSPSKRASRSAAAGSISTRPATRSPRRSSRPIRSASGRTPRSRRRSTGPSSGRRSIRRSSTSGTSLVGSRRPIPGPGSGNAAAHCRRSESSVGSAVAPDVDRLLDRRVDGALRVGELDDVDAVD